MTKTYTIQEFMNMDLEANSDNLKTAVIAAVAVVTTLALTGSIAAAFMAERVIEAVEWF